MTHIKKLNESFSYSDQWNDEIKWFMDGLKEGNTVCDDNSIAVEIYAYKSYENDPRFVVYEPSVRLNRLHDDFLSQQYSRELTSNELNAIKNYAINNNLQTILDQMDD